MGYVPLAEGEVGSDDGGPAFVPRGEDVEEQLSTGLFEGDESQLIDDEERDATKALLEAREDAGVAGFGECADEVGRAKEGDVISAFNRLDAEAGGEMGLAGTDGPEQHDVARRWYPRAAGKLLEARSLEAVGALPIELSERFGSRQSCRA